MQSNEIHTKERTSAMKIVIDPSISYVINGRLRMYRKDFLSVCGPVLSFPRNTRLSRSGEETGRLFYLLDGIVKVYTTNPSGHLRILGYHQKDSLFALDCLCPGETALVNTQSVTAVKVLPATTAQLRAVQQRQPGFWEDLSRYYCSLLRLMCFDAESNSVCDTAARLATFLCLFQRHNESEHHLNSGKICLTQEELASAVNASRIQIARICADFRQRGLIACSRGAITILDSEGLLRMSHYQKET